jgi:hypothetical protein
MAENIILPDRALSVMSPTMSENLALTSPGSEDQDSSASNLPTPDMERFSRPHLSQLVRRINGNIGKTNKGIALKQGKVAKLQPTNSGSLDNALSIERHPLETSGNHKEYLKNYTSESSSSPAAVSKTETDISGRFQRPDGQINIIYNKATPYLMRMIENPNDASAIKKLQAFNEKIRKSNLENGRAADDFFITLSWFQSMAEKLRHLGAHRLQNHGHEHIRAYIHQMHYPDEWLHGMFSIIHTPENSSDSATSDKGHYQKQIKRSLPKRPGNKKSHVQPVKFDELKQLQLHLLKLQELCVNLVSGVIEMNALVSQFNT